MNIFHWILVVIGAISMKISYLFLDGDQEIYSYIYLYGKDVLFICLGAFAFCFISYTSLIPKMIIFSFTAYQLVDFVQNIFVHYTGFENPYGIAVTSCVSLVLVIAVCFRFVLLSQNITTANMKPDRFYMIISRPQDFMGWISLVISGLGGGFSIYYDGCVWKFHRQGKERGRFVHIGVSQEYFFRKKILDMGPYSEDRAQQLNSYVGEWWSWRNNCWTVVLMVWSFWSMFKKNKVV